MNFLQDVAKEIGNGMQDLSVMVSQQETLLISLILVVTFSMLWLAVQSMEVSPQIRSPLSLVSLMLARLSLPWDCPAFS